jgi:acyl-CoA thioesterase II
VKRSDDTKKDKGVRVPPAAEGTLTPLSATAPSDAQAIHLLEILTLEPIELNLFRGGNEDRLGGRLFGGQVLAQALRAAANTVDGRSPHSLHGYFMRAGEPERPVLYEVERIRDGSSFTTRRVVAVQNGEAIFNMDVSFQIDEPGMSHEIAMPNVPRPDALEDDVTRARREAKTNPQISVWAQRPRPFEMRSIFPQDQPRAPREQFWNPVWVRFRAPLPANDAALKFCLLAYASDMGMVSTAILPHSDTVPRTDIQMASLDHALWFHRDFRIDDWLLIVKRTSSASGARGMNHAEFFDLDGRLVASASQEGLMRQVASR